MIDRSTLKLGGWCAILVGISYLIAGLTFFLMPAQQQAPASFADFMTSIAK